MEGRDADNLWKLAGHGQLQPRVPERLGHDLLGSRLATPRSSERGQGCMRFSLPRAQLCGRFGHRHAAGGQIDRVRAEIKRRRGVLKCKRHGGDLYNVPLFREDPAETLVSPIARCHSSTSLGPMRAVRRLKAPKAADFPRLLAPSYLC